MRPTVSIQHKEKVSYCSSWRVTAPDCYPLLQHHHINVSRRLYKQTQDVPKRWVALFYIFHYYFVDILSDRYCVYLRLVCLYITDLYCTDSVTPWFKAICITDGFYFWACCAVFSSIWRAPHMARGETNVSLYHSFSDLAHAMECGWKTEFPMVPIREFFGQGRH